ncbi:hypothetical protein DFH27DRAFT_629527 [Peziza echinospora]|nr:hypothetical protein DFH27DRAFT_629527 [Peziza echinospora]
MPLIGTISSLRILTSTKNFVLRYSVTGQVLALFQYLSNPYHPLRRKLQRKYDRQEHELVLIVQPTKKALSTKACVRTTIARKLREIAIQELRLRGWGRDGRPLKGGRSESGGGAVKEPLKGTIAFFPYEEMLMAKEEELRDEVRYGIDRFLKAHREQNHTISRPVRDAGRSSGSGSSSSASHSGNWARQERSGGGGGSSQDQGYERRQAQPPQRDWQQQQRDRDGQRNDGGHDRQQQQPPQRAWQQRDTQRPDGPTTHHQPQLKEWQKRVLQRERPQNDAPTQSPSQRFQAPHSPILSQTPRFPRQQDSSRDQDHPARQETRSDVSRRPLNIRFTAPKAKNEQSPSQDDNPPTTYSPQRSFTPKSGSEGPRIRTSVARSSSPRDRQDPPPRGDGRGRG